MGHPVNPYLVFGGGSPWAAQGNKTSFPALIVIFCGALVKYGGPERY